jgi:tRNA nucleotidyltransferase/poly(A) polymerase
VRSIRQRQAARFNFDIRAIAEDAMARQGKDGRKVVSRPRKRPAVAR